jgi:tetratricopeptide (TPR) repeat protein
VFYVLSIGFAVLAMKTKETAFTLPLAIVMYELMFFRGGTRKRLIYLGPLFLTMIIIPLTFVSLKLSPGAVLERITEVTKVHTEMSRLEYLFTEFGVIATYVRLLFLPVGQNLDYDHPLYGSFFEPPVLLSFVFLLFIFGLGVYMLRRSSGEAAGRLAAFGIFWFFLTLSVESSIIPIVDVINEHRVYLPSVGAISAAVSGAFLMVYKLKGSGARRAALVATVAAVIALSGATYARNEVWRSEIGLWQDVVMKSPLKARGHNSLGNSYLKENLLDKAIEHLQIALKLDPDYARAHNNIGIAYKSRGMIDLAIKHFQRSIKLKPDAMGTYINLGNAYYSKGRPDKAIDYYKTALYYRPDNAEAHYNIGVAYVADGQIDLAIEHYITAIEIDPENVDAYNNLGVVYMSKGMTDKALEYYNTVLRISPDYKNVHFNLGDAYFSKGLVEKAIEHYETFLDYIPDYAEAHYSLGIAYEAKGLSGKAMEHYRNALVLNPDYKEARRLLEKINKKENP